MKAKIYVDEREALKAGFDKAGDCIVSFDPADLTQEQRNELATCPMDAGDFLPNTRTADLELSPVAKADQETLIFLIDKRIELRAAKKIRGQQEKAKREADILQTLNKWVAQPVEEHQAFFHHGRRRTAVKYPRVGYSMNRSDIGLYYDKVPGLKEAIEDVESLVFWWNLEGTIGRQIADKRREEIKWQKEKEAAEKAARVTAQVVAWMEAHGTDSQKQRHAEGLLDEAEIISAIEGEAYAPLNHLHLYEPLQDSDVCECEYNDCDVSWSAGTKETATEQEFDQLQEIKKLLPAARVSLRQEVGTADGCEAVAKRTYFKARITVGELEFSRKYRGYRDASE